MRNKKYFSRLFLYYLIFVLLAGAVPNVFVQAEVIQFPQLPDIGRVTITETNNVGYQGRIGDRNRMAIFDGVKMTIEKAGGGLYPAYIEYQGEKYPVTIGMAIRRGDGRECQSGYAAYACNMGWKNLSGEGGYTGFGVEDVPRNRGERSDLVIGAPIPGPVTLLEIWAEAWLFYNGTQQQIGSSRYTYGQRLFTIAEPPRIESSNKTTVRHNETITLTGQNYDAVGAAGWVYANQIYLNVDRNNPQFDASKIINFLSGGLEAVHYCGPSKLQFEFPSGVSNGTYTITVLNEFGYSNSVNVTLTSGESTPKIDAECSDSGSKITSITPTSGPAGKTLVKIKGSGFASATSGASANVVRFNGMQSGNVSVNLERTEITALVPEGATTGPVSVTPAGHRTITGPVFIVNNSQPGEEPKSESIAVAATAPDYYYLGEENEVFIEGENFGSDTKLGSADSTLSFRDVAASRDGKYLTAILKSSATVPGTTTMKLENNTGAASLEKAFRERDPDAPQIASVTFLPSVTQGEVTMLINGNNLETTTGVSIKGAPYLVLQSFSKSESQISARVVVLDFNPTIFGLIPRAQAQTSVEDRIYVGVQNPSGQDGALTDASLLGQKAGTPQTTGGSTPVAKTGFEGICSKGKSLGHCVQQIYLLALGLGSIVAVLMIVLAGYRYMTAQGNAQQVESAKEAFTSAFIGLIIIFVAYILLYLINPDLVTFRNF